MQGLDLFLYEAPYGALLQEAEPEAGLVAFGADLVYIFLRWEDLEPRLGLPLTGLAQTERDAILANAVAMVSGLLAKLRSVCHATLVTTFLPRMWGPALGLFDVMSEQSEGDTRNQLKRAIAREMAVLPSALLCDLDEVATEVGRAQLFDLRLWETSRFPFSVAGAQAVVRRLMSYAAVQLHPKAKCIVLDADNTLWGGTVGEDGFGGIALGPDYPGSTYVAFQHRLLELQQRGLLLALCSKNNPQDVVEVLVRHPHQVLREAQFAAMRINWSPKPENLEALAKDLNLGLESFVFVDDSPHECLAVRQRLPQVTVVQTPQDILQLPYCLDNVARLEITSLTSEDSSRATMYAEERLRQGALESYGTIEEYLTSLDMEMTIGIDVGRHVARIAQLTQKTNQFNLTTRRYSEAQILAFINDPDYLVADFSLSDVFGNSGLVGVAIVRGISSRQGVWDTLLMSCRVIGRRAEQAFIGFIMQRLVDLGVERVSAQYLPTAKNEMVRDFWPSVGFSADEVGQSTDSHFKYDLRRGTPELGSLPVHMRESTE